jgi:hypothetical protein
VNDDAVRDIKRTLSNPIDVCERLGLLAGPGSFQRQGGGVIIRCPVHDDRNPSCSVQIRGAVILWKCHSCQASGDVLTLIAAIHGLTMSGDDFRQTLILGAELGSMHALVSDLESGERRERPAPVVRPELPPEPEREYPPREEVDAMWSSGTPFGEAEIAWATSRGLDPAQIGEMTRALPAEGALPRWASFRGKSWRETGHRVIVPVFDAAGDMRSVRAIRVVDGESPKRLPPGGHKAAGLVMACDVGLGMLRGTFAPPRVIVVEGEPDFLTAATLPMPEVSARIGITSGSWTPDFAARVPLTAKVYVGTHDDPAGEKYAMAIAATLPSHTLLRWRLKAAA